MTALAIVVQPGATPSSVMATLDIFSIANRFVEDARRFRIDLLSVDGGMVGLTESVSLHWNICRHYAWSVPKPCLKTDV